MFYLIWYLINSRKLLSENPQLPLKKSTPPFFTLFPPKTQQVQVHPFVPKLKIFQTPPAERGWGWGLGGGGVGGDTVVILIEGSYSSKVWFYFFFILCWPLKNILFKYANKIQWNLTLNLNTNVSTKNLYLYFSNLKFSYFIINLDQ